MGTFTLSWTALVMACVTLSWLAWSLYLHRWGINRLREEGVPMPAWSWLSGHLFYLYGHNRRLPPFASVSLAFAEMAPEFADDELFLLDLWPVSEPMLVVFNPEAAVEVCQKINLPKVKFHDAMLRPITGGLSLLSMNGSTWKTWRSRFNHGFSTSVMAEQLPHVVDSVASFREKLKDHVDNGIVCLDHLTTRLTFEIILKISLDANVGTQYDQHIFVKAIGNIVKWHSFWDPLVLMNPLRPFVNWYYGRIVNTWIRSELSQRYETLKEAGQLSLSDTKMRARSVMDLAIEAYVNEGNGSIPDHLQSDFLGAAATQMRLFLFAGNDTTSSTIVFAINLVTKHPSVLAKLREEHDAVFGKDTTQAAIQLKQDPSLLSKCKLTLAVIKETLRLYPPAATMRQSDTEYTLTTQRGVAVPIKDLAIHVVHHAMHLNNRVWPRSTEFLPERWLVGPDHDLYPQSGAWRAFEYGPRQCIGQTLAMNEMKVVLIMTARVFEFKPAYEEFDDQMRKNEGLMAKLSRRVGLGDTLPGTYLGDRAYQTEVAGAHPSDGYPCYVSMSNLTSRAI